MHRFYFHVEDGHSFVDLHGTLLENVEAAKKEAIRFAGALLSDHADLFWATGEWKMRVTDEENLTLFELRFFATESAAIMGRVVPLRPATQDD